MPKPLLLSTAYFPPVSWFVFLNHHSRIMIESQETYPKQTYRNRCRILGPNGLQILSVPVSKPNGNSSKTTQVLVSSDDHWKRIHWRAIKTAYNASPFFLYYRDRIEKELFSPHYKLFDLNISLIRLLLDFLDIQVNIEFTDVFNKDAVNCTDLRTQIHPKKKLLVSRSLPRYTQVFGERYGFVPDLGIIDLLFNEGPASKDYLYEASGSFDLKV
jgi:hypothetical protein